MLNRRQLMKQILETVEDREPDFQGLHQAEQIGWEKLSRLNFMAQIISGRGFRCPGSLEPRWGFCKEDGWL